jgi:hypothetical protein
MRRSPASPSRGLLSGLSSASEALLPSGWPALDATLGGGWPCGELSELAGPGRSSLALAAVREAQRLGQPVAWIDGPGTFCPATANVDLDALVLVSPQSASWSSAVVRAAVGAYHGHGRGGRERREKRRALLAADLLLRSRAFGLLVLDARGEWPPLSAWFRLARQARLARSVLLLLAGETPMAGSAAALTLQLAQRHTETPGWALPPAPECEVAVLRRRAAPGGDTLLLGPAVLGPAVLSTASSGAAPRGLRS